MNAISKNWIKADFGVVSLWQILQREKETNPIKKRNSHCFYLDLKF